MKQQGFFTKWIRLVLAAALGTPIAIALGAGGDVVDATNATFFPQTGFEIDGNLTFEGATAADDGDWLAGYGPGLTPGGFPTTGVYYNQRTPDPCNSQSDDIASGGIEVGQGPVWPFVIGSPNNKTDLLAMRIGAEKVAVPANGGSQINDILYIAFETCNPQSSGTFNLTVFIEGGDGLTPYLANGSQTGSTDDYLIIFDFQGGGTGSGQLYTFGGTQWVLNSTIGPTDFQQFMNTNRTVGEVALNLTALGIPSDGTGGPGDPNEDSLCNTITVSGQAATPTGGSLNSQVKDLVNLAPLQISNCGAIDISKFAADGEVVSPTLFPYLLEQTDDEDVHDNVGSLTSTPSGLGEPDADQSEINASIQIETTGNDTTHSWVNVLSQPDYTLSETVPSGWQLKSIVCSTTDLFDSNGNGSITDTIDVTIVANGVPTGNEFLVPPSVIGNTPLDPASCTIVNDALGITIAKVGAGTAGTQFTFDVSSGVASNLPVTINGASVFQTVPAAGTYTITEDDINALDAGNANPDWALTNIACVDNAGATVPVVNLGARSATVVVDGADDDIVCTFTNNQKGRLIVAKTGAPSGTFNFSRNYGANFALATGASTTPVDLDAGSYTITELLAATNASPAPDYIGSASCTGESPVAATTGDVAATVQLAAGETVTCTFNNVQNGRIVVAKQTVNGNGTFNFTGDVAGSITTAGGVGTTTLSADKPAGTYSVAETPDPLYTTSSSCSDGSAVTAIVLASGETVTCTFVNTRKQGTFTLRKLWGAGTLAGTTIDLDATVSGPAPIAGSIDTTSSSPTTTTSSTITVYSGQTVDFSEAFAGSEGNAYTTSVSCTGGGTLTPGSLNRSGQLVVGNTPGDVVCTFTNTPKVAGVVLQKNWASNANAGDSAALQLSTAPTGNTNSATSIAPAAPVFNGAGDTNDNSAFVSVVAGDTVTFTENLGAAAANYTTTFACQNATNAPVKVNNTTYTLLIAVADVNAASQIDCAFTNTRIEVPLVIVKDWNDAVVGNVATLTVTGSDTTPIALLSTAGAADETDTSGTFTVYAGESLSFAELIGPGDPAAYSSSFTCTGSSLWTSGQSLTVAPADTSITCTFTNTRRPVKVRVAKDLAPAGDDGAFDLSIDANVALAGAIDGGVSAPITVLVGDTVAVSEAAAAGSPALANYTSSLACDNGVSPNPNAGTSGSFVVPSSLATDTVITCTFTNTRKSANLTVVKDWGASPVDGDAVDLTISGGLASPVAGNDTNDGDDGNDTAATSVVYAGESISVAEAFDAAHDAAWYNTTLVCADAGGNLVDSSGSLTGVIAVPSTPTDITCTFTNDRKSATVVLQKSWANAADGHTAALSIAGISAASPATASSTVDGLPTFVDSANQATLDVYAGETVTASEDLGAAANQYVSELDCTDGTEVRGRLGTIEIGAADEGDTITCTFTNTRRQLTLQLVKDWSTSPANGDTVGLTIDGGLVPATNGQPSDPALDSNDGDGTNDQSALGTALFGETLTLAEAFGPGSAVNYTTSFACGDFTVEYVDGELSGTIFVDPADAGVIAAENTIVTCTYTNVRKSTTLTLAKAWEKPEALDTTTLSIDGEADSDSQLVTAPDTTPVASATVYAGETVSISEALGVGNVASYDVSDLTCTDGTPTWTPGALAATVAITADDTATDPISCTITNTAERGTIVINKAIEGTNDGTFDFAGTWLAGLASTPGGLDPADFSITTDGLTGTVTFTDVLIGNYSVTETDPSPDFDGSKVTCDGSTESTALPLTGEFTLADDATVTCTFTNTERSTIVVIKDAVPNAAADFGFTGDIGAFTLDDDADATLSNTFTSSLVSAQGQSYAVDETATPGWTLDLAASNCSNGDAFSGSGVVVTPDPGTTVTCTFVNNANPASLTATKTVDGVVGPWGPFTFTLAGAPFTGAPSQDVTDADPVAEWGGLLHGATYTLTEAAEPGYVAGAFTCTVVLPGTTTPVALPDADAATAGFQITVSAGATYDCDITNVAIDPTLVVTKTTVGGFDTFEFDVVASDVTHPALPALLTAETTSGDNQDDTGVAVLTSGVGYTVTERAQAEWIPGALTCTVDHADPAVTDGAYTGGATLPGDVIACSITNTKKAQIIVQKQTTPDGATQAFGFEGSWNGAADGTADFTLTDGASHQSPLLDPSVDYTVTELATQGWQLTGLTCRAAESSGPSVTLDVAPGEVVTCVYSNSERGEVLVDKVAGAVTHVGGNEYEVSYTLTVSNQSQIDETYSLSDTPGFTSGASISSMLVNGPGVTDLELGPDGGDIVVDGTIAARAGLDGNDPVEFTVTVTFTIAGNAGSRDCAPFESGNGSFNSATVSFEGGSNTDSDCAPLPEPVITVAKTVPAGSEVATLVSGNSYQATYTVTVSNTGDGPGQYSLTDLPQFAVGADVTDVAITPSIVSNVSINPDEVDVYTVVVTFTVDGEMALTERECGTELTPGQGGYNGVTVTSNGGNPTSEACVEIPAPELTVAKTVAPGDEVATLVSGNTYEATYTVTVSNIGDGPGQYDFVDLPDFSDDATIVSVTPPGATDVDINAGETDTYTVVVVFDVDPAMPADARACGQEPTADQGAYNQAIVTYNGPTTIDDDACVEIPEPNVTRNKTVDPAKPLTRNTDGTWTIGYILTVANTGEGPASYDLDDDLVVGTGVVVTSVTIDSQPAGAGATSTTAGVTATGVALNAGVTHTYKITVALTIAVVAGVNGDCDARGGGIANSLTITERGVVGTPTSVCSEFSTLTLIKVVNNDEGRGDAVPADFTLSATAAAATISGAGTVASAVPAGTYTLSESGPEGYTSSGYLCSGSEQLGYSASVPSGANVTCVITNDLLPVDLQLVKSDGGASIVAGGAPITYTLSVSNVGTRDVDDDEPVTVTDTLPPLMSWVAPAPAGCSISGQTLTCTIAADRLEVGDAPVVISAQVTLAADAPSGTYVNKAWVTTDDDPACEGEDCVPTCPEVDTPGQNTDCENTPATRQGAVQIVKTDDVAGGDSVEPGESFTYSLVVTNIGTSSLLPGTVVTDDLPVQLELVSVAGGAGWTCNAVDPIECTYAPALAPKAVASPIVVTVRVATSATGESITNVAVVQAAVERDCTGRVIRTVEAFEPACNQVSDDDDEITPLLANADLAIVKTASVSQVGAGGGFNWVLDVTNNGPGTALNVVVGDVVPSSLTVTGVSSSQFSCTNSGNTVTCTKASMAPAETGKVTISVTVPASAPDGVITNIGTVQSSTPDPNPANNSDDATVTVVAQQVPTTTLPPVILPPTGSNATTPLVAVALMLVLLGGVVVLATRRRREGAPSAG